MKNYNYGLKAEDRVAAALRKLGHNTGYYQGSKGPIDITATRGARRLAIQVKAVRSKTVRINDSARAEELLRERMTTRAFNELIDGVDPGWQAAVSLTNGDYHWLWRVHDDHDLELLHHGQLPKRPLGRE